MEYRSFKWSLQICFQPQKGCSDFVLVFITLFNNQMPEIQQSTPSYNNSEKS